MDQVVKAVPRAQLEAMERQTTERERLASVAPPAFVDQERSFEIELAYPIQYDGVVYERVTVTRPTIRQWRKYMAAIADAVQVGGEDAGDLVDPPYLDVPAVVYNALDFLDGSRVEAAVDGFFGRSSLPEPEENGEPQAQLSGSSTGEQ